MSKKEIKKEKKGLVEAKEAVKDNSPHPEETANTKAATKVQKRTQALVTKDFACSRGGHRSIFLRYKKGSIITDHKLIEELKHGKAPIELLEV